MLYIISFTLLNRFEQTNKEMELINYTIYNLYSNLQTIQLTNTFKFTQSPINIQTLYKFPILNLSNQHISNQQKIAQITSRISISRPAPVALGNLIKLPGRKLGRSNPNLNHQIIAAQSDPRDRPPPEESPNPNPIQFRDLPVDELPRDPLRVGGEVVGRQREAAVAVEQDGEVAGGAVEGIGGDVGGQQAGGEAAGLELAVGGARVRVLGERAGEREEENEGERDKKGFRHFGRVF